MNRPTADSPGADRPAALPPAATAVRIPAAGPASIYCTLYHRDDGFRPLAEAELHALGGGSAEEPGIWLSPVPIAWSACGYAIIGGRQLAAAPTIDALEEAVRALRISASRFCITSRRVPRGAHGSTDAKRRIANCIDGDVSLEDPQLRLQLLTSRQGFRLLVEAEAGPHEADWLGAKHKLHNYLVALPVRIAKAMLNLTARPGESVLDPFCGSGTIPLLAAWAGHPAFGSDISAACVARAGENLTHFGQVATLVCADAAVAEQRADCIVSNLPYGTYSHLAPDALPAILRNLARLAPRITLVTSARIEATLEAEGYELLQVLPVEPGRFERFVYLTRAPLRPPE